ncbi:MAG: N-acetyltransferase [bacterium]|nr:N-acetyltransferase [bacterium]MCP4965769.1 N-acetyltransferase [bacterium]
MIADNALVESGAQIGQSTYVWHRAHVRRGATIGDNCVIGGAAFIDSGVTIGNNCKIQNAAQVFTPATIEDGVFIGPGAILTNDRTPRAVNPDLSAKSASDWTAAGVTVRSGASIGAGAIIVAGVAIGRWAMVAAGAVVTRDVLDHELVAGVPATSLGWVDKTGQRLVNSGDLWIGRDGTRYSKRDSGLVEVPS